MIRPILRMGDPRLQQVASDIVRCDTPELHALVRDLFDTMKAADGAGLAATQIGVMQRVVVFGIESTPRYPDAEPVPTTVLVNPVITPIGDTLEEDWEGCLSVPGMRGWVPRHGQVRYQGSDQFGAPVDRTADGFHARVVQHECDHLDGILYPQRIVDMTRFGFGDELAAAGLLPGGPPD